MSFAPPYFGFGLIELPARNAGEDYLCAAGYLAEAIRRSGSKSALARALGINPQAIDQWDRVPHTRVIEVERITGIARHFLRPELYPQDALLRSPTHSAGAQALVMREALAKAIAAAGGLTKLGRHLGISKQAIAQWSRVPPERVLEVERLTGVSRHDLRPDLYPRDASPLISTGAAA